MNKNSILYCLLLILSFNIFSQENSIEPTITIRLYDKKVYTTDSKILVQVEFFNKNSEDIVINLAETRIYNFQFFVTTPDYQEVELSDKYLKLATYKSPYPYKELTLKKGERFSFIETLNDYVIIDKIGDYIVKALFFNNFIDSGDEPIVSNKISFRINSTEESIAKTEKQEIKNTKKLEKLPLEPDKVIKFILDARIKQDWDKFLLYLEIEKIYIKDPIREENYRKVSEQERAGQLKNFIYMLKSGDTDKQLIMTPEKYEIVKTWYTDNKAEVTVNQYFDYLTFKEKKEYIYKLIKNDGIWTVADYSVRNLGVVK